MTVYEEMYKNMSNLTKFYRYEGLNSYSHFSIEKNSKYIEQTNGYIYFSNSIIHHQYYIRKRFKQFILELMGDEYNTNKKTLLDNDKFNEIIKRIENHSISEKMQSIEFNVSLTFDQMLINNTTSNQKKSKLDRKIERVDCKKYNGGYGFCDDWLTIYNLFTYFYGYQRITKENLLDFLYKYRNNLIKGKKTLSSTDFLLNENCRNIKINQQIYNDFSKYELMNALKNIVEKEMYFPESIFASNPDQTIKKIIQAYSLEREYLLELSESINRRTLNK